MARYLGETSAPAKYGDSTGTYPSKEDVCTDAYRSGAEHRKNSYCRLHVHVQSYRVSSSLLPTNPCCFAFVTSGMSFRQSSRQTFPRQPRLDLPLLELLCMNTTVVCTPVSSIFLLDSYPGQYPGQLEGQWQRLHRILAIYTRSSPLLRTYRCFHLPQTSSFQKPR